MVEISKTFTRQEPLREFASVKKGVSQILQRIITISWNPDSSVPKLEPQAELSP